MRFNTYDEFTEKVQAWKLIFAKTLFSGNYGQLTVVTAPLSGLLTRRTRRRAGRAQRRIEKKIAVFVLVCEPNLVAAVEHSVELTHGEGQCAT
jgi:hypothetical protein